MSCTRDESKKTPELAAGVCAAKALEPARTPGIASSAAAEAVESKNDRRVNGAVDCEIVRSTESSSRNIDRAASAAASVNRVWSRGLGDFCEYGSKSLKDFTKS